MTGPIRDQLEQQQLQRARVEQPLAAPMPLALVMMGVVTGLIAAPAESFEKSIA